MYKKKPPTLRSPSICQPVQPNNAQKAKDKTSTTNKNNISPKPNVLKTTKINLKSQHQPTSKNTSNINSSETHHISMDNSKQ